jgi:predicted kinase
VEAVILAGIQGAGKSTFCRERFFDSHVRINLDMLRTRHREDLLIKACLAAKQPFVVDNTNPTKEERAKYVVPAKQAGFRVVGYYLASKVEDCKQRLDKRTSAATVPIQGLLGTYKRLELPNLGEGFDALYYVSIGPDGTFCVSEWKDEV